MQVSAKIRDDIWPYRFFEHRPIAFGAGNVKNWLMTAVRPNQKPNVCNPKQCAETCNGAVKTQEKMTWVLIEKWTK